MQLAERSHESWWFNRLGARSRAFATPFGKCDVLICNDRWNPEIARIPVLEGARYLLIPSYGSRARAQDSGRSWPGPRRTASPSWRPTWGSP